MDAKVKRAKDAKKSERLLVASRVEFTLTIRNPLLLRFASLAFFAPPRVIRVQKTALE